MARAVRGLGGWSLDITDFSLYGLVLRQALTELIGGTPTMAQIGSVGGLVTTIGLLGWAVGGFFFGIIADYLGRVRTLALSILIYSVFTALQGSRTRFGSSASSALSPGSAPAPS